MKYVFFALLLASSVLADSPAQISADFRKAAVAALDKVNDKLEKATTALIAKLVASGDTAGAEQLTTQLKAKLVGEPVPTPQASAQLLFAKYDQARAKALEPAQKVGFARIESMLKSASTPKLGTITELGKVRAEIEGDATGKRPPLPVAWSFRRSPTAGTDGIFKLNPDGTTEMMGAGGNSGTWKPLPKANTISVEWMNPKDTWTVLFYEDTDLAEVHSMVWKDTRYLKALVAPQAK